MRFRSVLLLLATFFLILSCKNEQPFTSLLARTNMFSGSWKIASLKVNGVEDHISRSLEKIDTDCDTQLLYRRDSLLASYIVFGKEGEYYFDKQVRRIDTSRLMDGSIDDSTCLSNYVFTRQPYDTTIRFRGFWTFTGLKEDAANSDQLYLFDRNRKEAQIWDILSLTETEVLLFRRYFVENVEVTEEMLLIPQ